MTKYGQIIVEALKNRETVGIICPAAGSTSACNGVRHFAVVPL